MSASAVEEDTNSLTADGPVISVSDSSGAVVKVTPSPSASNEIGGAGTGTSVIVPVSRSG